MHHRTAGEIKHQGMAALQALRNRAAQLDIALGGTDTEYFLTIWNSRIALRLHGDDCAVSLESDEQHLLMMLQDNMTEVFEASGVTVRWDDVKVGELAPGLSLMEVAAVFQRSPSFTRVQLRGADAARFGKGGLHFRLLVPGDTRSPEWPRITASGRTVWPESCQRRPVYTVAAQDGDLLDFDIFQHPASPTCLWAETCPLGATVGVMGPGGGWCPAGSPLILFGDETAQPAIARMLAMTAGDARAFLTTSRCDLCELAEDPRVERTDDLLAALKATTFAPGTYIWFAANAEKARLARSYLTQQGLPKGSFTAAAYWN